MNKSNALVTFSYEGAAISFQRGDSVMVNATQMAKFFNKQVSEFLRLPSTKVYIDALEKTIKTMGFSLSLIETKEGRNGGTWMHQNLALELSRWLSPEFSIWGNERILELMKTGETSIVKKPTLSKNRVEAFDAYIEMVAKRFSLDGASQQRMYNQFAQDNSLPEIDYIPTNGGRDSLTNLLKAHNINMSARQANKKLEENGFLVSREVRHKNGKVSRYYEVTDKGKEFGDNFQSEHNPKQTQPLWYSNQFNNLLPLFV